MFKPLLFYFSVGLLLLFTFSCGEDKKEDPAPEPPKPEVPKEEPKPVKCVLLKEYLAYPNGTDSYTREYVFTNGKITQTREVNVTGAQTTNTTLTFEYDANGNISTTNVLDAQGRLMQYFTFLHDAQGKIKQVNWFNKNLNPAGPPALYSIREYDYNLLGQLVSTRNWQVSREPRQLLNEHTFTYDSKGNATLVQEYRVLGYVGTEVSGDIMIKNYYTYDDKVNPWYENKFMQYIPPGLFIPTLSPNNSITHRSETTLEGTRRGPNATFDPVPLNFNRSFSYTYTDKNRASTVTTFQGAVRTFSYQCE